MIAKIRARISKAEGVRNVLTLITGTTIAQAIPVAISPILTRIYTPEDFGLFALYTSIVSILAVIATCRYELAIMIPEKDEDAVNIVGLSILISLSISTCLCVVIWMFNEQIVYLLGNPDISKWLYLVPINVLITGIYQSFNYWSNRKKKYKRLAFRNVSQSTSNAAISLGLGASQISSGGLIIGSLLGQVIATGILGKQVLREDNHLTKFINKNEIKKQATIYKDFPLFSTWSGWLNTVSVQFPMMILTSCFNSTVTGFYSLSHRLLNIPLSLVGSSVGQVFFQKANEVKNDEVQLKEITYHMYKKLLYIGLIPMMLVLGFGDLLYSLIFGPNWEIAGNYARVLSIWLLFVFISSPLSTLFDTLGKQKQGLLFNIIMFLFRVLALLTGALIFQDAWVTILLYAVIGALFWFGHCVYILKLVGVKYIDSLLFTIRYVCLSVIITFLFRWLIFNF